MHGEVHERPRLRLRGLFLLLVLMPGVSAGQGEALLGVGGGQAGLRPDDRDLAHGSLELWGSAWRGLFRPMIGAWRDELGDGAVFAGVAMDYPLSPHWRLIPSFAPSYYQRGKGFDLGLPLEFRSGLELARRWSNGHRLGLGIYHVSNANLGDRNPGVELLSLWWRIPLAFPGD